MPLARGPLIMTLLAAALLLTALPPELFAAEESFEFTPVSVVGSGGAHTAAEDGVFTLLGNPALLNSVASSMFFAFSGGMGNVYRDGAFEFDLPPAYYTLTGPLALGVVSKGVGFGVFDHLHFYSGGMDIDVVAAAGIDWALVNTAGVKLDFGLAPKLLFRFRQAQTSAMPLFAPSVTPGILVSFGERFSMGVSWSDALSVVLLDGGAGEARIFRSLNAGIAVGLISNGALGLTLFVDYRDLMGDSDDNSADPLRQLGVGARAEFWNNFWLSAGMSNSAPTAGLGLNLGAIKLDIALSDYGMEAGVRITRE